MSPRHTILALGMTLAVAACHAPLDEVALTTQKIYFSDRFFDVEAVGEGEALVVGYGGKALYTDDGGFTFTELDTGTDRAIYDIARIGDEVWASGMEGLLLYSPDLGKTWKKLDSGTEEYIFAIYFLDAEHGFAVGDRSTILETRDGGKTWSAGKPEYTGDTEPMDPDLALAMQDPVFYDVEFLNDDLGWIVGEFGYLLKTSDGGKTWTQQQGSLVGPHTGIVDEFDIPTFFGVTIVDENTAYAAGLEGRIVATRNGGETWAFDEMDLGFPIHDPLYTPYVFDDGEGWAIGAAGEVVHKAAGESTWRRADLEMSLFTWLRSMDFATKKNGWIVGGFGTILYTDDGGESWRVSLG